MQEVNIAGVRPMMNQNPALHQVNVIQGDADRTFDPDEDLMESM